jgi:hypothetical protein
MRAPQNKGDMETDVLEQRERKVLETSVSAVLRRVETMFDKERTIPRGRCWKDETEEYIGHVSQGGRTKRSSDCEARTLE